LLKRLLAFGIATVRTFILALTSTHVLGRLHDHDIRFDRQHLLHRITYAPLNSSGAPPTRATRKPKVQAFHSQLDNPTAASVVNFLKASSPVSQTLTEKRPKAHCCLPDGKFVKSGDYVTLRAAQVHGRMTS